MPSNGGPALRFKCSAEDRITKGGERSNLILLGVVIIFTSTAFFIYFRQGGGQSIGLVRSSPSSLCPDSL